MATSDSTTSVLQLVLLEETTPRKTCTTCQILKPLADFPKQRMGKDGFRSVCRMCHNAAGRLWKAANRERRARTNRLWKQQNPDKVRASANRKRQKDYQSGKELARKRLWKQQNPDKVRASANRARQKSDEELARKRLYRQKNHARLQAQKRLWEQEHPARVRQMKHREYIKNKAQYLARNREWQQKNPHLVRQYSLISAHRRREKGYRPSRVFIKAAIYETLEAYRIGTKYWDCYGAQLIDIPTIDHIVPLARDGDTCADNLCVTSRALNASKGNKPLLVWLAQRRQDSKHGVYCTEG